MNGLMTSFHSLGDPATLPAPESDATCEKIADAATLNQFRWESVAKDWLGRPESTQSIEFRFTTS